MSERESLFQGRIVSNKLWLISDTHFGHKNIVQYQQRPESHEAIMLSEWVWAVGEDEPILHLGDVFLGKQGNPARWSAILGRLPGRKFLILGNHDKAKKSLYEQAGFTIIQPFVHRGIAFTHRPISIEFPQEELRDWSINIHGHVHANPYRPEHDGTWLEGKTYINLSVEVTDFKPVRLGNVSPLGKAEAA